MAFGRGGFVQRGGHGARGRGRGRGGARGGRGGPKLPADLVAEVDEAYGGSHGQKSRPMGRKEMRKAERHSRPPPQTQRDRQSRPLPQLDDRIEEQAAVASVPVKKRARSEKTAPQTSEHKKKKRELRLPGESAVDAEDGEIEWLEYMLKKEKAKDEDGLDDGLDDLLELADVIGPGGRGLKRSAKGGGKGGDNDDDGLLAWERGSSDDDGEAGGLDTADELETNLEDEDKMGTEGEEEGEEESEGDDESGASASEGELGSEEVEDEDDPEGNSHGRLSPDGSAGTAIDSAPAAGQPEAGPSRYIPPHLRAAQLEERARGDAAKVEARRKLERKAQGLLNKLSEANIESILAEVEVLYRDYSRHDVTTTITSLVLEMISSRMNLLDSFVVLYATLIGALHRIIGLEFGAHVTHTLIMQYRAASSAKSGEGSEIGKSTEEEAKEALNLLALIAELYNAGVIGSTLVYDLIRGFLDSDSPGAEAMGERAVEGLLKLLRLCGQQLRQDDPASLKDIVGLVQGRTKGKEDSMTTRARFMVETLVAIQSGKRKTNPNTQDPSVERMKKFLASLGKKRRLLANDPLRANLKDLLQADTRGKWYLVGAGWSGNPLLELQSGQTPSATAKGKAKQEEGDGEAALYELARKQGMNTDVRRSVFVVLMTSEDYVHATDRLAALKFTPVQQREFVRVALHCAGLERTYNPYYTLLLHHLISHSHDHRFTFQYALWDFIREMAETPSAKAGKSLARRAGNVAKVTGYLVGRGGADLTVLKAVEWTSLTPFLSIFLLSTVGFSILATQTLSPLFTLPRTWQATSLDTETIAELFDKTLSNSELADGLSVLIRGKDKVEKAVRGMGLEDEGKGREAEVVRTGWKVGKTTLSGAGAF